MFLLGPGSWLLRSTIYPTLAGASFTHKSSNIPSLVLGKAWGHGGRLPVRGDGHEWTVIPCLV